MPGDRSVTAASHRPVSLSRTADTEVAESARQSARSEAATEARSSPRGQCRIATTTTRREAAIAIDGSGSTGWQVQPTGAEERPHARQQRHEMPRRRDFPEHSQREDRRRSGQRQQMRGEGRRLHGVAEGKGRKAAVEDRVHREEPADLQKTGLSTPTGTSRR